MTKQIEVDVLASLSANNSVHFDSVWRRKGESVWHTSPIELGRGSGDHEIELHLDDRTGLALRFYEDPDEAVWMNIGQCPTASSRSDKKQIKDKKTDKWNRKKLCFTDVNDEECELHFALRFDGERSIDTEEKAYPPYEYDPIIRNGGR
jgi:hypothetical protein